MLAHVGQDGGVGVGGRAGTDGITVQVPGVGQGIAIRIAGSD